MLRYCLLVTGPAYGTQQASSALLFARALIAQGHSLESIFFYREGVLNASQLTSPANDEFDVTRAWQQLGATYQVALNVCVAAALRRGVTDSEQARLLALPTANLQPGFSLSGLGELAQSVLTCDRVIQF
ncbi:sulfurtransferase complex subunit TusD [Symbiopectobacterium purcellii]|uniref:sulfurtransferase complex subunit TusD n=1 Tax=Symbiopectobacterium purcellii TaxID=2871826 RepID=UPI003F879B36